MKSLNSISIRSVFALFTIMGMTSANGADHGARNALSFSRQVIFELTFYNRDLIWLGDPASPTASVYLKPGTHPIATDLCVKTLVQDNVSPSRRYFYEARIATENGSRKVYAYSSKREKLIGMIDGESRFLPNEFYKGNRDLLPSWPADASVLHYDKRKQLLYTDVEIPGPLVSESLDFLPLKLTDENRNDFKGRFVIDFSPSDFRRNAGNRKPAVVALRLQHEEESILLATATVPAVMSAENVQIESYDNVSGTYLTEAAYRAGAPRDTETAPSVTFRIPGKFTPALRTDLESLVLDNVPSTADKRPQRENVVIDGKFDDWRNIAGIGDARGDVVPYLEYIPDVDLLEFKVSHDDEHIYLYARVAGRVGQSHPQGGRSYFYAYMDVDRDSGTGFLPTRDDDCYFGVDIGDDCEVQFEFVNNRLRKTFYGFCGIGGDANVLKQQVAIGPSQYGRFDENGIERKNYKSEYILRHGVTEITEDLKLGTSDTIHLAVSPDGSEVEVSSPFAGFLKNPQGEPTVKIGQTIDLAVGMECDSKAYPYKSAWAADSTSAIRGYELVPSDPSTGRRSN